MNKPKGKRKGGAAANSLASKNKQYQVRVTGSVDFNSRHHMELREQLYRMHREEQSAAQFQQFSSQQSTSSIVNLPEIKYNSSRVSEVAISLPEERRTDLIRIDAA